MNKNNKAKSRNSDKLFTLFQNKTFTLVFFLAVFGLLGGAFYVYRTYAATKYITQTTKVSLYACRSGLSYTKFYFANANTYGVYAQASLSQKTPSVYVAPGKVSSGTTVANSSYGITYSGKTYVSVAVTPSSSIYQPLGNFYWNSLPTC